MSNRTVKLDELIEEDFDDALNSETIKQYEKYLAESEDTKTSDMREDTYISGFRAGALFLAKYLKTNLNEGKANHE